MAKKRNKKENESKQDNICRICFENDLLQNLISPCLCKGGSKYVHHECLLTWIRSTNKTSSKLSCDICRYKYKWSNQTNKLFIMCLLYEFCKITLLLMLTCTLLGFLRTYNPKKFLKSFGSLVEIYYNIYYGFSIIIFSFGLLAWFLVLVFIEPNISINFDLIHYLFMPYYIFIPGFILFCSFLYIHFKESKRRYAYVLSTRERILSIS